MWQTTDGGASWELSAHSMGADYMPPDQDENEAVQDPHRIVGCAQQPDQLWCQHHNGIWRSDNDGRRCYIVVLPSPSIPRTATRRGSRQLGATSAGCRSMPRMR